METVYSDNLFAKFLPEEQRSAFVTHKKLKTKLQDNIQKTKFTTIALHFLTYVEVGGAVLLTYGLMDKRPVEVLVGGVVAFFAEMGRWYAMNDVRWYERQDLRLNKDLSDLVKSEEYKSMPEQIELETMKVAPYS